MSGCGAGFYNTICLGHYIIAVKGPRVRSHYAKLGQRWKTETNTSPGPVRRDLRVASMPQTRVACSKEYGPLLGP